MIDKASAPSGQFTTIIGKDAAFKGELSFEQGLRVDGRLDGKIVTKGLLAISQGGKVQSAEVEAGSIIVEGEVKGNLRASDRIELRKSARLKGDLCAAKLLVAEGASFSGMCRVGKDAVAAAAAPNRMAGKEAAPR
ncbi:MAG: polymer-forming cytoskeletal protein [Planctomycetota bacterium]